MKVMVETSAHHVHVTKETLEALFGKGATLTNKKNLSALPLLSENQAISQAHPAASLSVPRAKLKSNAV